jgi:DNA repair exonuclease SbcCD ATPase subunit
MSNLNQRDRELHGSFGDLVINREARLEAAGGARPDGEGEGEAGKVTQKKPDGPKSFKPNATVYIKSIKDPHRADEIRRLGCTGWPCHDGYLCNFCMLRPEWVAESKVQPLQEEVGHLRQTVADLRAQQADVETLRKAERLVAGKHWSSQGDNRISTLNSMLQDSRARLEAQEATARRVAAETVRDSLMQQLSTLQQRMAVQEKDFTHSKQKVEALCESLADVQGQLRFANEELAEKRMLISDAIKEKSRFRDMSRKLQLTIDAQNHELVVRGEQTKALILEVQRLQEIEKDRDRYRDLAAQRAGIAQSIMDAVSEDIIMAERMRDEHSHHIKKLNKEVQNKNKTLQQQNNSMSKLRAELTESRRKEEEGRAREETLKREGSFGMRHRSPSRGPH